MELYIFRFNKSKKTIDWETIQCKETEKTFSWKEYFLGKETNRRMFKSELESIKEEYDCLTITLLSYDPDYAIKKFCAYYEDKVSKLEKEIDGYKDKITSIRACAPSKS